MVRLPELDTTPGSGAAGTGSRSARGRAVLFAAICAACVVLAGGYTLYALRRPDPNAARLRAVPAASTDALAGARAKPHLLILDSDGDAFRRIAVAPLDAPEGGRALTDMLCQRVHFAGGRGICLGTDELKGGAFIFDTEFRKLHVVSASGLPSRTRVSPDGRYGTMTVFVQGHSYAEGGFSTRTTLVDMASGEIIADLEDFAVFRDGERFRSVDFNFWGVTFTRDSNRFYATLGSGGKTYLVQGDVAAREARVLRENAECPSISPDNTRLVFKKQVQGGSGPRAVWRLHVLDLATMTEQPLAETRNIDDQIEWLDAHTILYVHPDEGPPATIRPDLWQLNLDDGSAPHRLATRALSPAAIKVGPGYSSSEWSVYRTGPEALSFKRVSLRTRWPERAAQVNE
jgi:hypothetical protein